jgi:hypothetical protein
MASTKNVLHAYNWMQDVTMSSTSWLTSSILPIENYDNVAVQFQWSPGTPTGTLFLDLSANHRVDTVGNVLQQGMFMPIASTSVTQTLGSTGVYQHTLTNTPYASMRVRYVPSSASSSGVLNVWVEAKQI